MSGRKRLCKLIDDAMTAGVEAGFEAGSSLGKDTRKAISQVVIVQKQRDHLVALLDELLAWRMWPHEWPRKPDYYLARLKDGSIQRVIWDFTPNSDGLCWLEHSDCIIAWREYIEAKTEMPEAACEY